MKYFQVSRETNEEVPIITGYFTWDPFVSNSDGDTLKSKIDAVIRNEVALVNKKLQEIT